MNLQAGQECECNVELTTPNDIGDFELRWQMCTEQGVFFGTEIQLYIHVDCTNQITQQLARLNTNEDI